MHSMLTKDILKTPFLEKGKVDKVSGSDLGSERIDAML
jgi:hypothetical protein